MKTVNVHEAKTHLSRLLERAHAGEEIVIRADLRRAADGTGSFTDKGSPQGLAATLL